MNISNKKILVFGRALGRKIIKTADGNLVFQEDTNGYAKPVTEQDLKLLAFDWLDENWDSEFDANWNALNRIREKGLEQGKVLLEAIIDIAIEMSETKCEHNFVSAKNKVVKDGYVCLKCGALRTDAEISEVKA